MKSALELAAKLSGMQITQQQEAIVVTDGYATVEINCLVFENNELAMHTLALAVQQVRKASWQTHADKHGVELENNRLLVPHMSGAWPGSIFYKDTVGVYISDNKQSVTSEGKIYVKAQAALEEYKRC